MKNITSLAFVALIIISLSFAGCSRKDYTVVPVSGKVTCNGTPVAGLNVIFSPKSVGDDHVNGPWSMGVTDSNGVFMLKTRYKEDGAVLGMHEVCFEYTDIESGAMEGLRQDLRDAKTAAAEGEATQEVIAAAQERIDELQKKLQSRPKVEEEYMVVFEVSKGGTKDANFELPAN